MSHGFIMTKSEFLSLKAGDLTKTTNAVSRSTGRPARYYMVLGIRDFNSMLGNGQSKKCYIIDLYCFSGSYTIQYNTLHSDIWRAFACPRI